ncbi:MAG: ABC transporter permease [Oscillospiraceae bacterium]|nr:ABC transporter permease [Oscillospiraceae bacterium]
MADKKYNHIPKEKFTFVNEGERLSDQKFEDKPVSYFKDAWIRFRKSKASVVATIIIVCIILYAFLAPLLITSHESTFMVNMYAKKPARVVSLREYGIMDGGVNRDFSEKGLIKNVAVGIGAEDWDGRGVSLEEGLESEYQPMLKIGEPKTVIGPAKKESKSFSGRIDAYLEVGFFYRSIKQEELQKIQDWEAQTGKHVLYPLIEDNKWCMDPQDANYWYKSSKGTPVVLDENGKATTIEYGEGMMLEDNYKRDAEGNPIYWEYTGGGTFETAQLKIRVLYYNYYQYLYGSTPDYIMGTDSQGYDLALRIAGGIKLSLLVAVFVCVINFVLGSIYGAIEGYYGGTIDIVMERISDILWNVPFIVVATLFQIHLSTKLGAIPCLLFAYVVTGWISTAHRVRTQFYRFKTQEYVMAARTLGARDRRIIWKHIFPNSLGTIITSSALAIPSTMLSESMLSFLGIVKLGTAESTSLGTLLADASGIWTNYPHLMIYPAIVISLLMICFNLFGNGLRDAFNPALRGVEE